VLKVAGEVRRRPEGTANPGLASGQVELVARGLEVLNRSETPPFHHDEAAGEDLRLRYRYLDLRRPEMLNNLRLRHRVTSALRAFLDAHGFVDVETPILTKATPEGARDYLVPARNFPGKFYALPQSPQLFKQLLMMSGLDRYYQIARCFRDEDLRADRQPEFTQLDVETSFLDEAGVTGLMEAMILELFQGRARGRAAASRSRACAGARPWTASARTGPDLRNPLELVEIADLVASVEFKVFAGPAVDPNGRVAALRLPGRRQPVAQGNRRLHGLCRPLRRTRPRVYQGQRRRPTGRDGLQSPILKFLPDEAIAGIMARTGAVAGDLVFFGADKAKVVNDALGALRDKLGMPISACWRRAGGRSGSSISPCSSGTRTTKRWVGAASSLHRAERGRPRRNCGPDPGAAPCHAPMTWC
jgi:aspartyl-tRNA synthetase